MAAMAEVSLFCLTLSIFIQRSVCLPSVVRRDELGNGANQTSSASGGLILSCLAEAAASSCITAVVPGTSGLALKSDTLVFTTSAAISAASAYPPSPAPRSDTNTTVDLGNGNGLNAGADGLIVPTVSGAVSPSSISTAAPVTSGLVFHTEFPSTTVISIATVFTVDPTITSPESTTIQTSLPVEIPSTTGGTGGDATGGSGTGETGGNGTGETGGNGTGETGGNGTGETGGSGAGGSAGSASSLPQGASPAGSSSPTVSAGPQGGDGGVPPAIQFTGSGSIPLPTGSTFPSIAPSIPTSSFGNAVHVSRSVVETLSPTTSIFTTSSFSVFTTNGHVTSTAIPMLTTSVGLVPVPVPTSNQVDSKSSGPTTSAKIGAGVAGISFILVIALILIIRRRTILRRRAFLRLGEEF
ncbi:hypothetical protein DFH07DRAFT_408115 [Mycena maculata]|uniref:Uncharacterized protein n=1 Tax=Mycena maculata TaxID=230809 RepID=A0AAD7JD11_9AGAR|nr:hypothetical protein DFH07DRAFT_408115 [Mycena maculata]